MTKTIRFAVAVVSMALAVSPVSAGSYNGIAICNKTTGCLLNAPAVQHPLCAPDCKITPFGVVHPISYDGSQTSLQVRICVDAAHPDLVPVVDAAIDMWEGLIPRIYNCQECDVWEFPPPPSTEPFAFTTILHELGHCALGLDHVDRHWLDPDGPDPFEPGSFTRSAEALTIPGALDDGPDDIRGSADDFHQGQQGQPADSISWFREDDNDPFIVDLLTDIDSDSYSRSRTELPAGDEWGASANLCVFDPSLCVANPPEHHWESQSVMYSGIGQETLFFALGADDVNMLKMARTGVDWQANSPDDYSVDLVNVGDCSLAHEIKVSMAPIDSGVAGICDDGEINYSFDPGNPLLARHFSMVFENPGGPLIVNLNSNVVLWDYSIPIFAGIFETGDTSNWSATVP